MARVSATQIIASTFGDDISEWKDSRYQWTTNPIVYENGGHYYAVKKTIPKHEVGSGWEKHPDQFWAEKAGTILWVSKI